MQFTNSDYSEQETLFVEVILPLSLAINYTYRVPFELNDAIAVGKRVVVQFGKHKIYTALIKTIGTTPPEHYQAKYIIDVVDIIKSIIVFCFYSLKPLIKIILILIVVCSLICIYQYVQGMSLWPVMKVGVSITVIIKIFTILIPEGIDQRISAIVSS